MQMNKLISRTVLALALAGFCAGTAHAQTRIATVDVKVSSTGIGRRRKPRPPSRIAREDLLKELKGLGDDIKKAEDEYKKLIEEANDQAVSPEERDKRKKSAETKLKTIGELKERARDFDRNASAQLNQQAERMAERIDEKIRHGGGPRQVRRVRAGVRHLKPAARRTNPWWSIPMTRMI